MKSFTRIIEAAAVYALVLAVIIFGGYFFTSLWGIGGMIATELVMLALVAAAARLRRIPFSQAFPLSFPPLRQFAAAALTALGSYAVMSAVMYFTAALFPAFTNTADSALYSAYLKDGNVYITLLAIVILPAVCEELVFRGFLLERLQTAKYPIIPVIIVGIMFGGAHFDLYKFIPTAIMGAALAYIALKTKSVLLPVIFHLCNNAYSVITLYAQGEQSGEATIIFGTGTYIGIAVSAAVLGATLLFFGLRVFGVIPKKRWQTVLSLVLCPVLMFASVLVGTISAMQFRVNYADVISYPEQKSVSVDFELDEARLCALICSAYNNSGISADITVQNADGDVVYSNKGTPNGATATLVLDRGEYTLTCDIEPADSGAPDEFKCAVQISVVSVYRVALPETAQG